MKILYIFIDSPFLNFKGGVQLPLPPPWRRPCMVNNQIQILLNQMYFFLIIVFNFCLLYYYFVYYFDTFFIVTVLHTVEQKRVQKS